MTGNPSGQPALSHEQIARLDAASEVRRTLFVATWRFGRGLSRPRTIRLNAPSPPKLRTWRRRQRRKRPYDRLVSRLGMMFFEDPPAAFANLARWLAPGERFAFAVWGRPAENPWMTTVPEVVAEIIRARKELGLAANVADVAIAKASAAIAALSEARTAMVASHADLAEVQSRLGIRTRMDGPEEKLETPAGNATLREVA